MEFYKPNAMLFVPDNQALPAAVDRTTAMGIGAHPDDLEIMCWQGILECFGHDDKWFFGVIVTNGAGSPRNGSYKDYTDEEMQVIRRKEQLKSSIVGEYGAMAMLDFTSNEVKDVNSDIVIAELASIISQAAPEVVYTHNLADKHDTHVSVACRVIAALRTLPPELRPKKLYGCEVWRTLDWMQDSEKKLFDVSLHPSIANSVLGVHASQIAGGKRYDLATQGRRLANATYTETHGTDVASQVAVAMDLTPLINDPTLSIIEYVQGYIKRFSDDVALRCATFESIG